MLRLSVRLGFTLGLLCFLFMCAVAQAQEIPSTVRGALEPKAAPAAKGSLLKSKDALSGPQQTSPGALILPEVQVRRPGASQPKSEPTPAQLAGHSGAPLVTAIPYSSSSSGQVAGSLTGIETTSIGELSSPGDFRLLPGRGQGKTGVCGGDSVYSCGPSGADHLRQRGGYGLHL